MSDEDIREPDQLEGVPLPESRRQVIGHDVARAQIDLDRLPNALLLHGPRGIGKVRRRADRQRQQVLNMASRHAAQLRIDRGARVQQPAGVIHQKPQRAAVLRSMCSIASIRFHPQ